jgi:hypothetical protein
MKFSKITNDVPFLDVDPQGVLTLSAIASLIEENQKSFRLKPAPKRTLSFVTAAQAGGVLLKEWHVPKRNILKPLHLTDPPFCYPKGTLIAQADKLSIYCVNQAFLARIGDAPVVFMEDKAHIVGDCSSRHAPMMSYSGFSVSDCLDRAAKIDGTVLCLMGDYQSENYCHWLLDELPRLGLVADIVGQVDYVAMRNLSKGFHFETLRRCGIEASKILQIDDFSAIQAKNLIIFDDVPCATAPAHNAAPWMIDWLRDIMLAQNEPKAEMPKKIYLARDDAKGRRIIPDEQFRQILSEYGYKKIILEKLSVLEQVSLFAGAQKIVAPHGAGLANLIFCQNLEQIVEIFSPSYGTVFACVLADVHQATYRTFVSDYHAPGINPKLDDIAINLKKWTRLAGPYL